MKFSHTSNSNPTVEKQVRFFEEAFGLINQYLGKLPAFPFETPQSLLSKIACQLKFNRKEKIKPYLDNYIRLYNKLYGKEFSLTKEIQLQVYEHLITPWMKNASQWETIVENSQLIEIIENAQQDLEKQLTEKTAQAIYNTLLCTEKNHNHPQLLIRYAHILIASYRLKGMRAKAVDKYLTRIFSKNIRSFPFPPEIRAFENNAATYTQKREEYLNNITLRQQLQGLVTIDQSFSLNNGIYFFPIHGAHFEEHIIGKIDTRFGKTRFVHPGNALLDDLKSALPLMEDGEKLEEKYSEFFAANQLIAIVELPSENFEDGSLRAIRQIRQDLAAFNNTIGSHCYLHEFDFFYTKQLSKPTGVTWSGSTKLVLIRPHDFENLHRNVYTILEQTRTAMGEKLKQNEPLFAKAWQNDDISQFWQYIENLFWTKDRPSNEIKEAVKRLMKNNNKMIKRFSASVGMLFHPAYMRHPDSCGITKDERDTLYHELGKNQNIDFDVQPFRKKIKNKFLVYLLNLLPHMKTPSGSGEWSRLYENLLVELRDYRNLELHAGIINPYSQIKLTGSFFEFINVLRWELVSESLE